MSGTALSLAELEAFDPQAPDRDRKERRFLCPLADCLGKPRTDAHRCLSLNKETGAWKCHRCQETGILTDYRKPAVPPSRRDRARAGLRQRFAVPQPRATARPATEWRAALREVELLPGSPGADYLARRGVPLSVALAARVRFSLNWYGRAAVVFPVRCPAGKLVGAQGRYLDGAAPKTRSAGRISDGLFASAGAWESEALILCEAPIDALSLAAAGFPALAALGCGLREWLPARAALRTVFVATDADAAGDAAAEQWAARLTPLGARVRRLRPVGGRDWNEVLIRDGAERLAASLRAAVCGL